MPVALSLIAKRPLAGNAWSFVFELSRPLDWIAGQFIRVDLPHAHPDAEGTSRYFTIASAPYERHIQICTRLTTSSFKQALASLPNGGELKLLDLPAGDFIWPKPHLYLVFAAQGIGITPFYSMIKQRLHEGLPIDATLIYANLTPEIPLQAQLDEWGRTTNLNLHIINHPISADHVTQHAPKLTRSTVYVSGPQPLIELLLPPHNLPINQLKQDTFPNYNAANY